MGNVPIVYNDNVDELFTVVSMVVFASLDVASTVASVLLVLVKLYQVMLKQQNLPIDVVAGNVFSTLLAGMLLAPDVIAVLFVLDASKMCIH